MKKIGSHKGPNRNAFIKLGNMGLRVLADRWGGGRPLAGEINIVVLDKDANEFPKTIKMESQADFARQLDAFIEEVALETESSSGTAGEAVCDALLAVAVAPSADHD